MEMDISSDSSSTIMVAPWEMSRLVPLDDGENMDPGAA